MRKPVAFTKYGDVATLTLSRPPANLLDTETLTSLGATVKLVAGDESIRVLVVTGGEKVFSEGIDFEAFRRMRPTAKREFIVLGQTVLLGLERLPKPTIAAVAGKALGAGLELALSCDMRVASDEAQFGHPEILEGLVPMFGGSYRLERLIGRSRARSLVFFGEPIPAWEASEIGLIGKVTPTEALLEEARIAASRIAANPIEALRAAKTAMIEGDTGGMRAAFDSVENLFQGGKQGERVKNRERRSANRE